MIDRAQFSKALDEIRDLRAQLAAERFMHDRLRRRLEDHGRMSGMIAAQAILDSAGRPTVEWQRASAEQAATLLILRGDA